LKDSQIEERALAALSKTYPDRNEQIRILMEWSGSIEDSMQVTTLDRFPVYLLLHFEPEEILSFAKSQDLSTNQLIGAGRFYDYLGFRDRFLDGYPDLTDDLKKRILKAIESTGRNNNDASEFKEMMKEWIPRTRKEMILLRRKRQQKSGNS
jgi:hypothetical protein